MFHLALAAAVATAAEQGPRVHVEVERGPQAVALIPREAQRSEVRGLRRVDIGTGCRAPCDAVLDADAPGYFVAGEGVMPSSTFRLPPRRTVRFGFVWDVGQRFSPAGHLQAGALRHCSLAPR